MQKLSSHGLLPHVISNGSIRADLSTAVLTETSPSASNSIAPIKATSTQTNVATKDNISLQAERQGEQLTLRGGMEARHVRHRMRKLRAYELNKYASKWFIESLQVYEDSKTQVFTE